MMQRIYLDNAATTTLSPEVLDAMMPYFTEKFGNASSIYSFGREVRMAVEQARKSVANLLNAKPNEIFFTSGGTESSNTAIFGAVRDYGCKHIITSSIEHHATLHTVEFLAKQGACSLSFVKLTELGHIDIEHLEQLLTLSKEPTLVTLMHANNEIGNKLNIELVAELCKKYKVLFHSDTVQTVGHYVFDLQKLNLDFMNGSAHKFHGPKGTGMLYIHEGLHIKPFINGGSQERNMRAGTENVAGIVGFAKALELAMASLEKDQTHIQSLKTFLKEQLLEHIPNIKFNGDVTDASLYTVLSTAFPVSDKTEMLSINLDMLGICVSGGSACTSGAQGGSHVIKAIYPNEQRLPIRFSFCKHNTIEQLQLVLDKLKGLL